jgi:hypothetical protein
MTGMRAHRSSAVSSRRADPFGAIALRAWLTVAVMKGSSSSTCRFLDVPIPHRADVIVAVPAAVRMPSIVPFDWDRDDRFVNGEY